MCGSLLKAALFHTIAGSFGSICMGSLIVGPCVLFTRISAFSLLAKPKIHLLWRQRSKLGRSKSTLLSSNLSPDAKCDDRGCMVHQAGVISRHVNQWSFTCIGLYEYNFWDAGTKASQLFEAWGWTHVISDGLIMNAVAMFSMIISGSTALLGLIVGKHTFHCLFVISSFCF